MTIEADFRRLLSLVTYRREYNVVEGLDAFHDLLQRGETSAAVEQFLARALDETVGRVRGGLAFVLTKFYVKTGDIGKIELLCKNDDVAIRASVFDGLSDDPTGHAGLGERIVELAKEAVRDPRCEVRYMACRALQNQGGWAIDVSSTVGAVGALLADSSAMVRMQAACAIGNFARSKYDLAAYREPLMTNLRDGDVSVREWSAWALWQFVRYGYEIGPAVHDLTQLLFDEEAREPFRKNASRALLKYAKRSRSNAEIVRHEVAATRRSSSSGVVRKFSESLARLNAATEFKQ